jgi:hypothetical protein
MSGTGQTEKVWHRLRHGRLTSNNGNIWRQAGTAVLCQQLTFTDLREPLRSSLSRSQRGNVSTDLRMRCIASVAPLIRRCFCRLFRRILM